MHLRSVLLAGGALSVLLLSACGYQDFPDAEDPGASPAAEDRAQETGEAPSEVTDERPDISGRVEVFQDPGMQHVPEAVTYDQSPPVGGDHNPVWLNCGVYDEPVPDWHAVHSLEHGAVWLSYDPEDPAITEEAIATLEEIATIDYMIIAPYPGQGAPVKATAWGLQMSADTADDPAIMEFVRLYNRGPQTPEPGATCSSGTTEDLVGQTDGA